MPPPFVAVIQRGEGADPSPVLAPSQLNARLSEIVFPQKAPDPPRYGDTPARKAKQQRYSVLAIRQIRAVAHDSQSGVLPKTAFDQFTSSPRGKSLTWDNRSNIEKEYPRAYGSNFSLSPQVDDEYNLRLMMGY